MSTICSIASGAGISLYHEAGDSNNIYLKAETVTDGVGAIATVTTTIKIPIILWEHLRQYSAIGLSLAQLNDEQLRAHVEKVVDERIAAFKKEGEGSWAVSPSPIKTKPSAPRAAQIRAGIEQFQMRREEQRKVIAAVQSMAAYQTSSKPSPTVASLLPET